jgi:hypothetical protein
MIPPTNDSLDEKSKSLHRDKKPNELHKLSQKKLRLNNKE